MRVGSPIRTPSDGIAVPVTGGEFGYMAPDEEGNGGPNKVGLLYLQGGNVWHFYHLSVQVAQGSVMKGAILGYSGSTGHSSGPHLHLEMRDARGSVIRPEHWGCSMGLDELHR